MDNYRLQRAIQQNAYAAHQIDQIESGLRPIFKKLCDMGLFHECESVVRGMIPTDDPSGNMPETPEDLIAIVVAGFAWLGLSRLVQLANQEVIEEERGDG